MFLLIRVYRKLLQLQIIIYFHKNFLKNNQNISLDVKIKIQLQYSIWRSTRSLRSSNYRSGGLPIDLKDLSKISFSNCVLSFEGNSVTCFRQIRNYINFKSLICKMISNISITVTNLFNF